MKAFWRSYRTALEEAQRFLFRLGDEEAVTQACASATVGKLLPDALYVHHSAEEDLPALLRVLLDAARCIVGDIDHNVVKLATNGRAVSFLAYQDFDEDPHPRLRYAVRVNLPRATYKIRNYTRSANPPILHRKDALVAPSYPHFEEFRALTLQEESHGLLERPDIGHARGWAEVLKTSQLYIEGHRLLPLRTGQGT